MLFSAGRVNLPKPHMPPTYQTHGTLLKYSDRTELQATQPHNQHMRRLTSCWVIAVLHFIITREPQKGGFWTVLLTTCQGWRLDKCWGLGSTSSLRSCPLSPPATSGLLRAVAGGGWGQSNRRRLCPHWRAAEPTGKPTPASQLIDGTI